MTVTAVQVANVLASRPQAERGIVKSNFDISGSSRRKPAWSSFNRTMFLPGEADQYPPSDWRCTMRAFFAAVSTIAAFSTCVTAGAGDLDCGTFLQGTWAGRGEVDVFGTKSEVDNAYAFNVDGSFRTVNRYRSEGQDWSGQDVSGTRTAAVGMDAASCDVRMETTGDGMTASTTSTYTRIDDDTVSTMGFRMQRVEQAGDGE